jgi:hypothetical protein
MPARPAPRRRPKGRPNAIVALQGGARPVYRNWLIYGEPGVGKTVLAGTAPKALILSYDTEGTESARAMGSTAHEWQIETWVDYLEALEYFQFGTGCQDYDWVVSDNISTLEEHAWAYTMGEGKKKNKNRNAYKPALGDYPIVWNMMKEHVREFNRLPINVLYTANTMRLDTFDTETEEDRSQLMPLVGSPKRGDTSARICAMVSLVGLLRTVKVNSKQGQKRIRRLLVEESDFWVAKSRYPQMGPYLNRPTVESMAEMAATGVPPKTAKRSRSAAKPTEE